MQKIMSFLKENKLFFILYVTVFFWMWGNFLNLRMLNFDQLYFSNKAMEGDFYKTLWDFIINHQGRANFSLIPLSYIDYLVPDNKFYYGVMSSIVLTILSIVVGYFVYLIFKNVKLALLSCLILFAFNQITMEPIAMPTAYVGSYGTAMILLVMSFILFIKFLEKKNKLFLFISFITYSICVFSYEVFIIYCLMFIFIALGKNIKGFRLILKLTIPYFIIVIAYLIIYLIIKYLNGGNYSGSQISEFSFENIIITFLTLCFSAIPGYLMVNDSVAYHSPLSIYSNINSNTIISSIFDWEILLITIMFFIIFSMLLFKFNENHKNQYSNYKLLPLLVVCILFWLLPNSMYAISTGYQQHVLIKYQQTSVGSFYSYISLIILITIILVIFIRKFDNKIILLLISLMFSGMFYLISYSNNTVSEHIKTMYTRWELMDEFLESDEFTTISNGSHIYAPSMFDSYALLSSVPSYYWTDYIRLKTNKNINVVSDPNEISNNNEIYYLKFEQFYLEPNQYLIFGKLDINSDLLNEKILTDRLTLYTSFDFNKYGLLGTIENENEVNKILLDNNESFTTDIGFQFMVNNNESNKHTLNGNDIDMKSITIIPSTAVVPNIDSELNMFTKEITNTLEGANKIKGIYEDNWLGKYAEFEIRTGISGELTFKGILPEELPKNRITIEIQNEIFTQDLENEFDFNVPVPKESIINVKLYVENSFVPAEVGSNPDLRDLSILLEEIEGN